MGKEYYRKIILTGENYVNKKALDLILVCDIFSSVLYFRNYLAIIYFT